MQKIIAPQKFGDKGDAVANLQEALPVLIKYKHLKLDQSDQTILLELAKERVDMFYGDATVKLVSNFRKDHNLGDEHLVDDPTADLMNSLLDGIYTVSGRVLDVKGIAVAGVVVRAYDQDRYREDLLGEAVTDAEGKYSIDFSESQFRKTKDEVGGPDVIVRAYSQEDLLLAVSERKTMEGKELTNIDLTIRGEQYFTMKCVIRDGDGNPAKGFYVQVFDRDLRKRQLLGTAKTDANGKSRTDFVRADFQLGDSPLKRGPRLVVEVRKKQKGELLATQEMEMKEQLIVLEFKLPGAAAVVLSEWERYYDLITPLRKGQAENGAILQFIKLELKDIGFVAKETGLSLEHITILITAIQVVLTFPHMDQIEFSPIAPYSKSEILAAAFYGWFREGQSQQFKELIALPVETLRASLSSAIENKIIPALDEKTRETICQALHTAWLDESLKPAAQGEKASLGNIVNMVVGDKKEDFLQLRPKIESISKFARTAKIAGPEFHATLVKEFDLEPSLASKLQNSFLLNQITLENPELTVALAGKVKPLDEAEPLHPLAALTSIQWLELSYAHGVPPQSTFTHEEYADLLQDQVEKVLPTPVLLRELNTQPFFMNALAIEPGIDVPSEYVGFASLHAALEKNPSIDIIGGKMEDLTKTMDLDKDAATALAKLKHLNLLGARFAETASLLENRIDHARRIVELGPLGFEAYTRRELPASRRELILETAQKWHARYIGMVGYLQPYLNGITPNVMNSPRTLEGARQLIDSDPTLSNLFGSLDQCYCDPCMSVLSPSAYLADLLKFIEVSHDGQGNSVGQLLEKRRPDIYDLELSCENSEIEVLHIDLVNEILENAIALPIDIPLPLGVVPAQELKRKPLSGSILAALQSTSIAPLSGLVAERDESGISKEHGLTHWIVTDQYRRWVITASDSYLGLMPMNRDGVILEAKDLKQLISNLENTRTNINLDDVSLVLPLIHAHFSKVELPLAVTTFKVKRKGNQEKLRIWDLDVTLSGTVEVLQILGTIGIFQFKPDNGEPLTLERKLPTRELLKAKAQMEAGIFPPYFSNLLGKGKHPVFSIAKVNTNLWRYYSTHNNLSLVYRPASLQVTGITYQSVAPDQDLLVSPQNRNPYAYKLLDGPKTYFPWSLPYNEALQETRFLLDKANLPRLNWLNILTLGILTPGILTPGAQRSESPAIIQELLGLSSSQYALITTIRNSADALYPIWGLEAAGELSKLRQVSEVLKRTRLSFDQLQDLLESPIINPAGLVSIDFKGGCDTDAMRLIGGDETQFRNLLDHLHRYVRLQRALGWDVQILDMALATVSAPLSEASLASVAHVVALSRTLQLPVETILAWFVPSVLTSAPNQAREKQLAIALDLEPEEFSLAILVLSKAAEPYKVADPFANPGALRRFVDECIFVKNHGQSWSVLAYALLHAGPDLETLDFSPDRSRQWLVNIHRQLALTEGVVITAPQRWLRWGLKPLTGSTTEWSVTDPLDKAKLLQSKNPLDLLSRLDVLNSQLEMDIVLLTKLIQSAPLALIIDQGKIVGLQEAHLDILDRIIDSRILQQRWLRWGLTPPADSTTEWSVTVPDPQDKTKLLRSNDPLALLSHIDVLGDHTLINIEVLKVFINSAYINLKVNGQNSIEGMEISHLDTLERMMGWFRSINPIKTLSAQLATELGTEAPIIEELITHPLTGSITETASNILLAFLLKNSVVTIPDSELVPFHEILTRIRKLVVLNNAWQAKAEQLIWTRPQAVTSTPRFAGLTGIDLAIEPVQAAPYHQWKKTSTLFSLANTGAGMASVLHAYLSAAPDERWQILARAFGLSDSNALPQPTLVKLLAEHLVDTPENRLDPLWLANLCALLALTQRIGAGDEQDILSLGAVSPNQKTVSSARSLLARLNDDAKKEALRSVEDRMREERRDRLVDYLLWRERAHVSDVNDLYKYYLIDIEMSARMNTTRVLQATAAVQLLVQRCLMNLEEIPPSVIDTNRWEWSGNYRVWEANRKVFLYPENWLYPELRDDRTEVFHVFEGALRQNEPSHGNAVLALRQYLDDLISVGQITVIGMYDHPNEDNSSHTLYLVGRTMSEPYQFYWRKVLNFGKEHARWTGWARIDQDLSQDHVVPFVLGGEFYIAWPQFQTAENKEKNPIYSARMAFARLTPTGWTKRQLSHDSQVIENRLKGDDRHVYALKLFNQSQKDDSQVQIGLYTAFAGRTIDAPKSYDIANISIKNIEESGQDKLRWEFEVWVNTFVRFIDGVVIKGAASFKLKGITLITNPYVHGSTGGGPQINKADQYYANDPLGEEDASSDSGCIFKTSIMQGDVLNLTIEATGYGQVKPIPVDAITGLKGADKAIVTIDLLFDDVPDLHQPTTNIGKYTSMVPVAICTIKNTDEATWTKWNGDELPAPAGSTWWSSGYQSISSSGVMAFHSGNNEIFAREIQGILGTIWYVEDVERKMIVSYLSSSNLLEAFYPLGYAEAFWYRSDVNKRKDDVLLLNTQQDRAQKERFGVNAVDEFGLISILRDDPRNKTDLEFDLSMSNANYNWEVFFHAPLMAAVFLSRQHRFEDARKWFHLIFDPTTNDSATGRERFWRFRPFRHKEQSDSILKLLETLAGRTPGPTSYDEIKAQIDAWLADPFNPFAVARLRTSAFEWFTVISYIKNLIEWGDQLFRRDTREAINEATLMYVLASELLGKRPEQIKKRGASRPQAKSYRSLQSSLGDGSTVWLALPETPGASFVLAHELDTQPATELIVNVDLPFGQGKGSPGKVKDEIQSLSSIGDGYFCVPPNEKLPELWDIVDDRLFKIRNSQNIEGVERELALYEPPIDPELLIRAKAAGLSLADVLNDRFAPLSHYRFQALLQKANEFCNEVKGLGGSLLSALEKKDSEHLALLRSSQEIKILELVEQIKKEQIKEANANLDALKLTRANSLDRFSYLQRQLGKSEIKLDSNNIPIVEQTLMAQVQDSQAPNDFRSLALTQSEVDQVLRLQEQHIASMIAGGLKAGSAVSFGISAIALGYIYDPSEKLSKAFAAIGHGLSATADSVGLVSTNASFWERRSSLISNWQRRHDEWVQQSKMTAAEIRQIDRQIIASEIRISITEKELENHRKQIEFASNIDDYLRHVKFSGEALYTWMESQLSGLYFGAYQMAVDLARKAERSLRHELGDQNTQFVRFGHWDNLRKGLLSGEQLSQDLRRMEATYMDRNRREREITKHISLRQLDALQLMKLRATGKCEIKIPEYVFNLDFPGHYFRRIKSVSISIPAVTGPYTGISGTLTLLKSQLREKSMVAGGNYMAEDNYLINHLPVESIAISSGQNDSGLFELNFRDERYLPFEGAGAISEWRLVLPEKYRAFNYDTISDVVIHIHYTARDGGSSLANAANTALEKIIADSEESGLVQLISLKRDFAAQWSKYKANPPEGLSIELKPELFPYLFGSNLQLNTPAKLYWIADDKTLQSSEVPIVSKWKLNIPSTKILSDDPYLLVPYGMRKAIQ